MSIEIAVDIGGTFTDLVVREQNGRVDFFKSSTTPNDLSNGIFEGLKLIATQRRTSVPELLSACGSFACGTTAATNAILEGKVARTALLCTEGFRDVLAIREGGRADTYDIYVDYPEPYIPRHLTFGVRERMNAEGGIEVELDEDDVRRIIVQLKEERIESVAVCLLWSIINPKHERRIGELLTQDWPGIPFSLSHEVNPTIREYRRTSATVIDASLKPIVARQILGIDSHLRANGFVGVLSFVSSNGGRTSATEIVGKPIYLCLSGPSAAPVAGTRLARLEDLGDGKLITVDMGGTSFDVSITTDWTIPMHREGTIDGHIFGIASVDLQTIGAGGGSLAKVDAGGLIHVGPASAGSFPGPACYQRGGDKPTVTDANLVLGLLNRDTFAGGLMKLSSETAEEVIQSAIAKPLRTTTHEAASLICLATEQNMVGAIEKMTIRRGIDPREYVLVAGGAAAGLHAAAIARELGIRKVLVPAAAGVLSAFGISVGDIKWTYARSFFTSSARFDFDRVNEILADLTRAGTQYLEGMGVEPASRHLSFSVEARYSEQVWQLTLPLLDGGVIADDSQVRKVVEAFHDLHERVYSVRCPDDVVEFTEWNLQATGRAPELLRDAGAKDHGPVATHALGGKRVVHLKEAGGQISIPVFDGELLQSGNIVSGPALIESPLTAVLVPPAADARLTAHGNIIIELS